MPVVHMAAWVAWEVWISNPSLSYKLSKGRINPAFFYAFYQGMFVHVDFT